MRLQRMHLLPSAWYIHAARGELPSRNESDQVRDDPPGRGAAPGRDPEADHLQPRLHPGPTHVRPARAHGPDRSG